MQLDLSAVVDSFALDGGVSVTRREAGSFVDGLFVAGAASTFTLDPAAVFPAGFRELQLLPEGQRTRETIVIYSRLLLRTSAEPAGAQADLVTYQGKTFEVQSIEDWAAVGNYYRALATKVPVS